MTATIVPTILTTWDLAFWYSFTDALKF